MAVRKTLFYAVAAPALLLLASSCRDSARKDVTGWHKTVTRDAPLAQVGRESC